MLKEQGDTIVEVILAFAVFSLVSVGAMTVMGQGTNASQRALEITLVKQQIDGQAEGLRAAHQAYTATTDPAASEWRKFALQTDISDSANPVIAGTCPVTTQIQRSFVLNPQNASLVTDANWFQDMNTATTKPYAQVETTTPFRSHGIWIQRDYQDGGTSPDYFTFTIRACWYAAGSNVPAQLDTVVRLYEPGT